MYVDKLLEQPQILTIFMCAYLGPLSDRLSLWELFHEMKTLFKQSVFKKTDGKVIISLVFFFHPLPSDEWCGWSATHSHEGNRTF